MPELYARGQHSAAFNLKVYLGWVFMGASEAVVIYFVMHGLFGEAIFTDGHSLFAMGVLAYSSCVIVISIKLQ